MSDLLIFTQESAKDLKMPESLNFSFPLKVAVSRDFLAIFYESNTPGPLINRLKYIGILRSKNSTPHSVSKMLVDRNRYFYQNAFR